MGNLCSGQKSTAMGISAAEDDKIIGIEFTICAL